jgi:outer membrane receptor protein involved in Fe transport
MNPRTGKPPLRFSAAAALALALSSVLVIPLPAPAAETVIDEIQVTATRRATSIRDISAGLTRIGEEAVDGEALITDALAFEPGLYRQQTTAGQGQVIIRGLKGSEILHLVDGVRLNNAIFRNAPTQYFALVPVGAVDRIEVIRGAAASLYGSDAVGGVVNVVTRVPSFDTRETTYAGNLSVGADTAELGQSLSAAVEAGNERLAVLGSFDYRELGNRRVGGGERIDPSGYRSRAGRLAAAFTPDDGQRWFLDVQHLEQPSTPRVDELVPGFGETEPASAEFWFEPNRRQFAHLQHSRADGWLGSDWVVDLAWQRIDDDRRSRDTGATVRRLEQNRSDLFELSVNGVRGYAWGSIAYGAEWYHDEVSSTRVEEDIDTGGRAPVASRFPDGSEVDQAAVYTQAEWKISDRQALIGGLRLTDVNVSLAATPSAPGGEVDTSDLSGELGWLYRLTDELQLVANASRSFRAPNIFDLGTLGPRPGGRFNIANPDLEPESARQLDVGLRVNRPRLRAEVMAYVVDYSDRISSVLTGEVTPEGRQVVQNRNIASATIYGLEAGGEFDLSDRAMLRAVLNYTRGEEEEADSGTTPGDRIPPLNGAVSLSIMMSDALEIEPRVEFAAEQDRLSPRDVRDSRINPDGTPGWATLNLEASWQAAAGWDLTLAVENILDKRYRIHGSGIDAPGRNLSLRLDMVF